ATHNQLHRHDHKDEARDRGAHRCHLEQPKTQHDYTERMPVQVADLRAELLSFPAGKHDDQVDALGPVGQLLDKINAGQKPKPPDVAQPDAYRPAFEEIPGDNWKTM